MIALSWLLTVARDNTQPYMADLVSDLCEDWPTEAHWTLARALLEETLLDQSSAAAAAAPITNQQTVEDENADYLYALQLQDEEDQQQQPRPTARRKKKNEYRPFMNSGVAQNKGPTHSSTAASANRAHVLQPQRSLQGRSPVAAQNVGLPASQHSASIVPTPVVAADALVGDGLTWAERFRLQPSVELRLKILTTGGAQYRVDASPRETFADIKTKVEKLFGISINRQRISYNGREMSDMQKLGVAGLREGLRTVHLSVRQDTEQKLGLRLAFPSGDTVLVKNIPESMTVSMLKQRIEHDHGIRAKHLHLTFYGTTMEDERSIIDCGVADGGKIVVAIHVPAKASPPTPATSSQQVFPESNFSQYPLPSADAAASRPAGGKPAAEIRQLTEDVHMDGRVLLEYKIKGPPRQAATSAATAAGTNRAPTIAYKPLGLSLPALAGRQNVNRSGGTTQAAEQPRSELIRELFDLLDEDGDGVLNTGEFQNFAAQTFEGTQEEWVTMFEDMCTDNGRTPKQGIHYSLMVKLVDDDDPLTGCYCSDQELRDMIGHFIALLMPRARELAQRKIFKLCDQDGDGILNLKEMMLLAIQTGFDGSEQEWASEYKSFCTENNRTTSQGINEALMMSFLDGDSDSGCYSDDAALQRIIQGLRDQFGTEYVYMRAARSQRPAAPPIPQRPAAPPIPQRPAVPPAPPRTEPPPAPAAPIPSGILLEAAPSRAEVIVQIFVLCDEDGDGVLNQQEMGHLARQLGFAGSDQQWVMEYNMMCTTNGRRPDQGIDYALMKQVVDDQSHTGCYRTDVQLIAMVTELQKLATLRARQEAQRTVFCLCDEDGDGVLNESEMLLLARELGFSGSDMDWGHRYRLFCTDCGRRPEQGIRDAEVKRLLDGELGADFHSSYAGLQRIMRNLHSTAPFRARAKMKSQLFCLCDRDGDGILNCEEMFFLANMIGFDGSKQQWKQEFETLCIEHGRTSAHGIDKVLVMSLLDDQTASGCFCSDEELKAMIDRVTHMIEQERNARSQQCVWCRRLRLDGWAAYGSWYCKDCWSSWTWHGQWHYK